MRAMWIDAVARTLLHSLWEGAAVALALAVILCFLRSSRARYATGCVAMLVVVGSLLVTFAHLSPERPVHIGTAGAGRAVMIPTGATVAPPPVDPLPSDDLAWLVLLWMAGVLLFYMRGIMSWMAARRLRRTGVCVAAEQWHDRLRSLGTRLGLTKPVALWESCLADVPLVIGYVRPIVLMPVGLLAGLPTGQVEAILLHELAHIRRYDYLVNLLQVFAEGLLFYHPAVWWISGVMRTERENCCDDLVVQVTGGAWEYATALTALEQRRFNTAAAMAATGGNLVSRVQRLLGRPEPRFAAAMPVFTAGILALTAVTAVAALQLGPGAPRQSVAGPPAKIPQKTQLIAQAEQPPLKMPDVNTQPYSQQAAQPDRGLFDGAIQNIERGQFETARRMLNTLINTYSNSEYLMRAKLAIAESWYRQGDAHGRAQAEIEYKDFILFYPNAVEAKEAQLRLNLLVPYRRWLDEDVVYIITSEERKAFTALTTDEEREKFVEQFWARRDPTPGTTENEFKEEHYRRIAYANEHFISDIPGWQTDRGGIYIQYGPPDEIESHSGSAPPFEQWRYRWIEGKGQNVILEFVDQTRNGEYKLTMDPAAN